MSMKISRRDMLACGLGAAGLLAGGGRPTAWAAELHGPRRPMPDRSQDAPSLPVAIQQCESYEPQLLRGKIDKAIDLIDGIETNRGGEGAWIPGVEPIRPKLLVVGRNAVCTDAVCAAVMGYDPQADHKQFPPFQGENHLKLLASVGVGTNDVGRIEVLGLPVPKALHPFNPRRLPVPLPSK